MLFPTIDFAIFFGIVFVGNWLLAPFPKRWRVFILVASYVFYGWWDWRFVFLLGRLHALHDRRGPPCPHGPQRDGQASVDDHGGRARARPAGLVQVRRLAERQHRQRPAPPRDGRPGPSCPSHAPGRDLVLHLHGPVVCDRHLPGEPRAVALARRGGLRRVLPHLVAGPIVRGSDLLPQIRRAHRRDPRRIALPRAAYLIFAGLFKKVVLSSYISSQIVDPVFANPHTHSSLEVLLGDLGLRGADLLRLQRLHRHRHRLCAAARLPLPGELQRPLHRPVLAGLLAAVAHDACRRGCATTCTSRSAATTDRGRRCTATS